ncbi:MAG: hypothetical protein ACT4PO_01795 [Actinomycetota bacterium]
MSSHPYRDLIFEREDGSQVLVTIWPDIWPDDPATLAERPTNDATWGPPIDAIYDSERRAEK